MHPFIVLFVLSWGLVASIGTLLVTIARVVFGSLPYAEGKYALVLAALGIAATVEVFGFTVRRWLLAAVVLLAFAAHSSPTQARLYIRTGENALAPLAFTVFCLKYPRDCKPRRISNERVTLTSERARELATVNTLINRSIRPERNFGGLARERWLLYPASGECHDYVVTKRHELIARGWPGSLLIAVVLVPSGEGHAVLVVPTDRGDLVLDSLRSGIVRWDALPYQWLTIMSPENPQFWRHIKIRAPGHPGAHFYFCTDTVATTMEATSIALSAKVDRWKAFGAGGGTRTLTGLLPTDFRTSYAPSCARASRWRQGQALRVLRNLDAAGRDRMIHSAGSEGMPPCPTKRIRARTHKSKLIGAAYSMSAMPRWRPNSAAQRNVTTPRRLRNCSTQLLVFGSSCRNMLNMERWTLIWPL